MTNNINNTTNRNNIFTEHNTHSTKEMPPDAREALWITVELYDCYNKPYKVHYCSNCGAMFSETFTWLTYYNYCPQCGDHMRRSDWDEIEKAKLTKKSGD